MQERKVAPPDFPQPEHYRPLGTLLQGIKRGQRFHPLTVADIRSQVSSASYSSQACSISIRLGAGTLESTDRPNLVRRICYHMQ